MQRLCYCLCHIKGKAKPSNELVIELVQLALCEETVCLKRVIVVISVTKNCRIIFLVIVIVCAKVMLLLMLYKRQGKQANELVTELVQSVLCEETVCWKRVIVV